MASELSARLDGRQVPQAIDDFMRQPWAHHVTMAVLREGEDSDALRDALALADGVLRSWPKRSARSSANRGCRRGVRRCRRCSPASA